MERRRKEKQRWNRAGSNQLCVKAVPGMEESQESQASGSVTKNWDVLGVPLILCTLKKDAGKNCLPT